MAGLIKAAGDDGSGISKQDLLEILGEELFDKLRYHFGGRELRIPQEPSDEHPLVVALGRSDADRICDEFALLKLYIPKSGDHAEDRDEFIRRAILAGIKRGDIAAALDISTRNLRRITSRLGLSGQITIGTGWSVTDVARSLTSDPGSVVNLADEYFHSLAGLVNRSAYQGARAIILPDEKTDRHLAGLPGATIKRIERLFQAHLDRQLTQQEAGRQASLSLSQFKRLLGRYRETGTIRPSSAPFSNL